MPDSDLAKSTQNMAAESRPSAEDVTRAMQALVRPGAGNIGCVEALKAALGVAGAHLTEFRSAPLGARGQRLIALRYLAHNGPTWSRFFSWKNALEKVDQSLVPSALDLIGRLEEERARVRASGDRERTELLARCRTTSFLDWERVLGGDDLEEIVPWVCAMAESDEARRVIESRFFAEGPEALAHHPEAVDWVELLSFDLRRFLPTTVTGGRLQFVICADKGEMGVRAVRETVALGLTPVVLYSQQDDDGALQVRLAEEAGGFAVALQGNFRETYANPVQIAEQVLAAYAGQFGEDASSNLARSALYPGYGPLAENTAAIEVFRRSGIIFIGPMQDVVERAGDKRKFRLLAESIDPGAVTPGIVMDESDPATIIAAVEQGAAAGKFVFPGRIKAANGGGGRGQVVIHEPSQVPGAVTKVLAEIRSMGWDQGVMFEQNIFETTHLEVQVVRDRFGNTRHFGMRDCTEQRASQKIQEEAPPAILRASPDLEARMCEIAVRIADSVGYVGACTVELMYKDGHFYLLEMNTRIQVEHPVTEEAHRIERDGKLEPLNLVQLQIQVAAGRPIDFSQAQVVQTHVAREFRINAESFKPDIKDPRDGKKGLFLPNAGVFDEIFVPQEAAVMERLVEQGVTGIAELTVRFDCGFEVGDDLVNKDPTFGKLIVAVKPEAGRQAEAFEMLRLASLEVLGEMRIEGRQLLPNGKILEDRPLETNLKDHQEVLQTEMLKLHSRGGAPGRHVNWLIDELRSRSA